ncbi:unnamed protein product [Adineta ricciae]|uniref:G-protein coupled receptors family 1 profile domain-containing protein n=1 Tax=Adineta ricciae TaxID=249248 RepID=A0A814SR16_ADIRI|nr:unnamed protein product [Adineta ricciae]CAF1151766.1 unnamed protein product [Adineta ricciae]
MKSKDPCPSIYQDIFANPYLIEQIILTIYSLIFIIGLVGNIMTIIIIKYNKHLHTPTNLYLLNLAVSDLMILLCNLPLEMLEIYHREWPLSVVFCKLRNICAEFFTCSSILTILAFTCERYFAIVHPIHLHRLSHFRRAQNIIIFIWVISFGFSLPFGLTYEIEINPSIVSHKPTIILLITNKTELIEANYVEKTLSDSCKACVPKQSLARLLSMTIIITSCCFFYLPMIIIGAIYLFIGQALRRVAKYEVYTSPVELSTSSQSSLSQKEPIALQQQGSHMNSYSYLKMRARCQARKVVIKTLIAVVSAFFICYAPLYLQRLLLAIINLNANVLIKLPSLSNFMAYLYVLSGVTFYFGSVINPILYNLVSNKYRRAFRNLIYCRLLIRKTSTKKLQQKSRLIKNYPYNHPVSCQKQLVKPQIQFNITQKTIKINAQASQSNSSSRKKRSDLYE